MDDLDISLDTIAQLKDLNDILSKALVTGDEVILDSYVQLTNFTIALTQAIHFIKEWQEEHGYIEL